MAVFPLRSDRQRLKDVRLKLLSALIFTVCCVLVFTNTPAIAKDNDSAELARRIAKLEKEVKGLISKQNKQEHAITEIDDHSGSGAALFLFGTFCALWAQNTGRNPWLWFFLGLFFSIITVLFLLSKNANDLADKRKAEQFNNSNQ